MNDTEFIDALQAEVKRLTDLNREFVQQIQMLQAQLENRAKAEQARDNISSFDSLPERPARRNRNYFGGD